MTILEFFKTVHPSVLAAKMIFRYLQKQYPVMKIADIADTTSGGTPNRGMVEYYNGEIPWVKSGELRDGLIATCDEYITEQGLKNSSAKIFPKGTLLVAMYGANIGKTGVLNFDATTNQAVCAIFPKIDISKEYLYWYFKQQRIDFIAVGKGGAQPNISQTIINNASIVVPDDNVQKQIVAFLERIEKGNGIDNDFFIQDVLKDVETIYKYKNSYVTLSDSFKAQLTQIENLNQAILQEAVQGKLVPQDSNDEPASELLKRIKAEKDLLLAEKVIKKGKLQDAETQDELLFKIPKNWVWCKLDEICKNITDGTHQTPKYTTEGRMFLSAQNVKPFRFMPEDHKYVSEEAYQGYIKNRKPELGDLLIGRVGAGIGETAVIDQDLDFCIYVSLGLVQPFKQFLSSEYLAYVFNSPYGYKYAKGNISSKGGSAGNFNLGRIRSFLIPLPPLSEQKRIVAEIEKQLAKTKQLKEHIIANQQATEQLLKALLHQAFEPSGTAENADGDEPKSAVQKSVKQTKGKVIDLKPSNVDYYRRTVLAAEIVFQLQKEPTLGHLKLQKLIYLCQKSADMQLPTNFLRQAMGPYDNTLMRSIDKQLKEKKWFEYKKEEVLKYQPLEKAGQHHNDFIKYFSVESDSIQFIIDKFKIAKSDTVEIVATLYACMDNMLNENVIFSEGLLMQRFYNWSEEKKKFSETDVNQVYLRMKETGIVPKGLFK